MKTMRYANKLKIRGSISRKLNNAKRLAEAANMVGYRQHASRRNALDVINLRANPASHKRTNNH